MTDRPSIAGGCKTAIDRARRRLVAPRDIAALAAFRVAFGTIVLISAVRLLRNGWVDQLFVRPTFKFHYWGFSWLPPPPPALTAAPFVALGALGVLVALGLCYRVAIALLFLLFTYLQLVDVANYLNHYYLVSLLALLLFFIPAHRAFSIDARWRPRLRAVTLPAWCTFLLRFQVAIVYVNAGLAKATSDWLWHAQPLNIWLSARTSLPVIGPYVDYPNVAYVAAWMGFLFDSSIAFFLLWRRARPFAYGAVIAFHCMTFFLFPAIGMFPVIMVVSAMVFFDSSWPRRVLAWVGSFRGETARAGEPFDGQAAPLAPAPGIARAAGAAEPTRARGLIFATAAGAYIALQILLPLRAHAYGGNVLWHEQGMRFSWRVMARAKNGAVTFMVRDPQSGRRWQVPPTKYLTRLQEREMAVQPDLIWQLAQHIARDFAASGYPHVEVHADARASLNGRPAALLIDPAVDLARQSDDLGAKPWIMPAPQTPPPHLKRIPHRAREKSSPSAPTFAQTTDRS